MEAIVSDELYRIGPGLGGRSRIWAVVKKKIQAKVKAGTLLIKDMELEKLDKLTVGTAWLGMVPAEFMELYGNQYDERDTRAPLSTKIRDQIIRDVPRTFTLYIEHQKYLRLEFPSDISAYVKALQHVLEVACHQDYSCGYCQGMNFLAATFLLSEANHRSAFILFSYLVKECHLEILYNPKCSSLLEYMHYYDRRLALHNKAVHTHLEEEEFPPLCYTVEWFTTCFLVSSPGELSACVIDLMLSGFSDSMVRVGLALMDHLEAVILQSNAEKLQLNFKKMLVLANCVEVMTRALAIPCDDIDGASRLETMKRNTDNMDPDAEWVDTMRSPTFRLCPGDPLPDELKDILVAESIADLLLSDACDTGDTGDTGDAGTTEETASGPRSAQTSVEAAQVPVPLPIGSSSSSSSKVTFSASSTSERVRSVGSAPSLAAPPEPPKRPRSAIFSALRIGKSKSSSTRKPSPPRVLKAQPSESGGYYDAPTLVAVSPTEASSPNSSVMMSESSNGHHCITVAGALDGHLVEDYVPRPAGVDAEVSCTDSAAQQSGASTPTPTRTPSKHLSHANSSGSMGSSSKSHQSSAPSPKPSSTPPPKLTHSNLKKAASTSSADKKKKKAQFVSSDEAAAKEIMALFMG